MSTKAGRYGKSDNDDFNDYVDFCKLQKMTKCRLTVGLYCLSPFLNGLRQREETSVQHPGCGPAPQRFEGTAYDVATGTTFRQRGCHGQTQDRLGLVLRALLPAVCRG